MECLDGGFLFSLGVGSFDATSVSIDALCHSAIVKVSVDGCWLFVRGYLVLCFVD